MTTCGLRLTLMGERKAAGCRSGRGEMKWLAGLKSVSASLLGGVRMVNGVS